MVLPRNRGRRPQDRGGRAILERRRVNEEIRVKQIRVVTDDGEQLGLMTPQEAMALAFARDCDLVEVAPTATPPVCKIMDYGKFKYQQTKKSHEAKKKQKTFQVKEVKFRLKTETHDFNFKVNHIERFIEHGDKVKVSLMYRGRENAHKEMGFPLFARIVEMTKEFAQVESPARIEGRSMSMLLCPRPGEKKKLPAPAPAETPVPEPKETE